MGLPYIASELATNTDAYGTRVYTPDKLQMGDDGTGDWVLDVLPGKIKGSIRPNAMEGSYEGSAEIYHTYIHSIFPDPWAGFQLTLVFKFSFDWKELIPSTPKVEGFKPEFGPCEMGVCMSSCETGICIRQER